MTDQLPAQLRELAEMWLYDGDTDQPVNDGYYRLLDLADSLAAESSVRAGLGQQR